VTDHEITVVRTEDDLRRYSAMERLADPDNAHELDDLRQRRAQSPAQLNLVGSLHAEDVAIAGCGEPGGPPVSFCWSFVRVLPAAHGRGLGRALADRLLAHARGLGKTEIESWVSSVEPAGIALAESYGLREVGRIRELQLELSSAPPAEPVPGIQVATYAELEGAVEQELYEVAVETVPDMPAPEPLDAGTYDEWADHQLRMIRTAPDLTTVARVDGRAVGYAMLSPRAGGIVGQHRGTFVLRALRGRGVARALKQAQIEAARRRGLQRLITQNADSNVAMRRVNERLGYRPLPDRLWMRGSLA
jgi:GNAT superfamily N-acetyltransferase